MLDYQQDQSIIPTNTRTPTNKQWDDANTDTCSSESDLDTEGSDYEADTQSGYSVHIPKSRS
jgi:hypothetical protein